jgi:glucose-6-phosphate-specific signal transduction histidine kinase
MSEENNTNKYVTEEYLDKRLTENNQVLLGAMDSILIKRLTEIKEDLSVDINNNQTIIDGYVKAQEDFKQEFVVMKEEFKQMKQIIKEKLGIEIRAI